MASDVLEDVAEAVVRVVPSKKLEFVEARADLIWVTVETREELVLVMVLA